MTETTRQPTCEERLPAHREGRLADFRDLVALACGDDPAADTLGADRIEELGIEAQLDGDARREDAETRMLEYPLGVSAYTTFKVELSTGGPADWLEVVCTGDTPKYEATRDDGAYYEVERIVYHFADWFDHAEDTLTGEDREAAEAFVSRIVPELID